MIKVMDNKPTRTWVDDVLESFYIVLAADIYRLIISLCVGLVIGLLHGLLFHVVYYWITNMCGIYHL